MSTEKVIGYKGFNKNLQCTPDGKVFQYEVGKTYEESEAVACKSGFHFCKNPFFVWDFYSISESRFCVVESDAENVIDHENKSVTKKITIKAELALGDFIKECVKSLIDLCSAASGYSSKLAASGDYSQLAASGHSSQLAASGDYSQLAASGDYSRLAASGYSSQLAASGDYSQLAASGHSSQLAASGDYSRLAASGYSSQLAASGDYSQLAASGYSSKLAASGYSSQLAASSKNSVVAAIGANATAKAVKDCWIVLAEYDSYGVPLCVKSAKIDGEKLKENTEYTLKNGEFCEVTE